MQRAADHSAGDAQRSKAGEAAGHEAVEFAPGAGWAPGVLADPDSIIALQGAIGNAAIARLLRQPTATATPTQPAGPPANRPVPQTSRADIPVLVHQIHWMLRVMRGSFRESVLQTLLVNQDRAGQLKRAYEQQHGVPLIKDIEEQSVEDADALRAADYLNWGRLRPLSKVLFAMDVKGTKEETVYRTLKDAHDEGAPDSAWTQLVQQDPDTRDLKICKRWSSMTLDQALDDEMSDYELDKARAILRRGELDAADKIRVATNKTGTDEDLLFEGLREANPKTIRREYLERYGESLDTVLFDQYDEEGERISEGDLSGRDAAEARAFLGGENAPEGDPDRLIRMVKAGSSGAGTDESFIWREIQAVKTRAENTDPAKAKDAAEAKTQLQRLRAKVVDPEDPLDLTGTLGELSDDEYARLEALLEISVGDPMLDDPYVQKLRSLGGIDWDAFDALLEADKGATTAFADAWNNDNSYFHRYLTKYVTVSSGKRSELYTIFNGSLYDKLVLCRGGFRDDYEDYAYNLIENHATDAERLELRRALRALERDEEPANPDAGRAMAALIDAFNSDEMARVRKGVQAGDLDDPLERAQELEENIERERSGWYGLDEALKDERREMRAGIEVASLDAQMTPGEAMRLRGTQRRAAAALEDYIKMRDEAIELASQIVNFAVGLIVTAVTVGAAGPLVLATLVRAAVVSGLARVLTDKALRGDRFDLIGDHGAKSFLLGATDGVMNVLGGRAATAVLGKMGGPAVAAALTKGNASFALKTLHTALEGGMSGGVGSVVDTTAREQTWKHGVLEGLGDVVNEGLAGTGQGAAMSTGIHVGIHGAKVGGATIRDRVTGRPGGGAGGGGAHVGGDPGAAHAADAGTAGAAGEGGKTTAAGRAPQNPLAGLSPQERGAACQMILEEFGQWETAIAHLQRGSGLAENMHPDTRAQLLDALVSHRAKLVEDLKARFGAEPAGGASNEPGSDADLNVRGDNAGQDLIAARQYLDEHHPGWERKYRMALMIDTARVGTAGEHLGALSAPERASVEAQVQARITRESELFAMARQLRQAEPGVRAQLLERLPEADRARATELANMDAETRRRAHDQALMDGDALAKRLRDETDPAERLRLAQEATYKQMYANMLNDEAYITPGAVSEFVAQRPVANASERYQASLDQALMIGHQVHASGGALAAMRRYEIFKYITRFCELVESSGLIRAEDQAKLTWFKNWSEYVYRVEREATGSATAVEGRQIAGGAGKAGTRVDVEPTDVRPGASDKFLLDNYRDFVAFADRYSGILRGEAHAQTAPGGPAGAAGPHGGPPPPALLELPRPTAADEAALAAPQAQPTPEATGVKTPAAGAVAEHGRTPLLGGRPNEAIGNPIANERTAQALARRLASGDVSALAEVGVTNVPPNYDPRGREWGVGRRADGRIVLIEGDRGGVDWENFLAQGGHPLSHTHPLTPGRQMKTPGKTMFELIPGTGVGNADSIHVLPSVEDFIFCFENRLEVHDVHTPYVHEGNGRIGNPDPANPLPGVSFQIVGTTHVGDTTVGPVVRSMLVAHDAQGNVLGMQPVYVVANPRLNSILLKPPDRMIPVEGAPPGTAGSKVPTGSGSASTPSGSVPPWRQALLAAAPDAAATDAIVHAFEKDLARLENLVGEIGAPAVHALGNELGGPAQLEALSRDVGNGGLRNLARDLKGNEIQALVKSHGADRVRWAAADLRGSEARELLSLPKAELTALSQPAASGGVTGQVAYRLLTSLERARLTQLIPAVTPANLSTLVDLLGAPALRNLADVKIKQNDVASLNGHATNLAAARPGIDAPGPLKAESLVVDTNTMVAVRKLLDGADWGTGMQPAERNAVNAIRRRMKLPEFDTSSPPPLGKDGKRELATLVGTTDLRGPNVVLSELDPARGPRPPGVEIGVDRNSQTYADVLADLAEPGRGAARGPVGGNKGAADRAAIADALFAAQPPGSGADPVFMTMDGDVFTRLIPWAVPPVVIPAQHPTASEVGMSYAMRFAFQNRDGFTVQIRGRRLRVIPVSR